MTNNDTGPVVLVVDDEDAIRQVARRALQGAGYRVIEASNGADALAVLDQDTPLDLVLSDIRMPMIEGAELGRRLRLQRPDLKILYVSGFVDELFEKRPILWEGEAFLDKPFTTGGLLEAVSLLLYNRRERAFAPITEPLATC